jgi:hypothetical protein
MVGYGAARLTHPTATAQGIAAFCERQENERGKRYQGDKSSSVVDGLDKSHLVDRGTHHRQFIA